ncbi:competence protein ComJ [Pedobacter cryoconitis]|uniref:Competence protein J (ComJ) n=1 Tax=Pedobacter cryoconitis TaxID=188932 RepID=A0A7X0MIR6_9SPHI|nr:competence protein ComJ [Pedobacter cryoconitis]MBB6498708.1 hypothetical protein [Pedobacter cryoconitis]
MIAVRTFVSQNQIVIRSAGKKPEFEQWTAKNREMGMIWHPGYIVLDPLVEGSFNAFFLIKEADTIHIDQNSQRSALIPFEITDLNECCISTVSEIIFLTRNVTVDLEREKKRSRFYPVNTASDFVLEEGTYVLHFQVCIGWSAEFDSDTEEVYYRFDFIKEANPEFKVLIDDDYGWNSSTSLIKE